LNCRITNKEQQNFGGKTSSFDIPCLIFNIQFFKLLYFLSEKVDFEFGRESVAIRKMKVQNKTGRNLKK